jgi:hypothetical protein
MDIQEFERNLLDRDIEVFVNNTLLDIRGYSGVAIHALPKLQLCLGHIRSWAGKGWFKGTKTFRDMSENNHEIYSMFIKDLYRGFRKGLYKI